MTLPKILLVNPPIFDFTAYDFWLRPYGMLRVAGKMQNDVHIRLFDYMISEQKDAWGRGRYFSQVVPKPSHYKDIPRHFRRFGRPRTEFRQLLEEERIDAALIQTTMTYWYPGVSEVIEDLRELQPAAKIVLGGPYATLCPMHAHGLGADLVIEGSQLEPLWRLLSVEPRNASPYWTRAIGAVGVLKLTEGCPFKCTYCSVPIVSPGFVVRPTHECLDELCSLVSLGVKDIAFYDDALLYLSDQVIVPFLEGVLDANLDTAFHTPNALNARFMTGDLARLMVRAGFRSFFLGFESGDIGWQRDTGGKVWADELSSAAADLRAAGAQSITSYIIMGHPASDGQALEPSMHFAHQCGMRVLLSEFSPIPGTVDGEKSARWADLAEPLSHNKTAFTIRRLGVDTVNRLKGVSRWLNGKLRSDHAN